MVESASNNDSQKVNMILDAAQKRFGHYGLAKTTMTEIATDVGLSKASLYYYFEDKETLFRAVVKREQDGFIAEMNKVIFGANDSAQNQIKKYVQYRHEYFLKVISNLGQAKLSVDSLRPLIKSLLDEFFKSEVALVSDILKDGVKKGEFNKVDVAAYADVFIATMNGLRTITMKNKETYMLEQSDYNEIENRIKIFSAVFIKGILKSK